MVKSTNESLRDYFTKKINQSYEKGGVMGGFIIKNLWESEMKRYTKSELDSYPFGDVDSQEIEYGAWLADNLDDEYDI